MKLTFLGAAGEVTGSSYLVETDDVRFLVDCGMFQGGQEADKKNRTAFKYDPKTIDFVVLTHAHIDHSGLLPRLSAWGFRGPVYCTTATADLLQVMLKDSAYIQEKEVEWRNQARRRSSQSAQELAPLYTVTQAEALLKLLHRVDYNKRVAVGEGIEATFYNAGHILGSAMVRLTVTQNGEARVIVFSGDLGQPGHPIVRDPAIIRRADILLIESTYGNRLHRSMPDTLDELVSAINDTLITKGGNIVIPAFTVGRTQDLLFLLIDLYRQGRLGEMSIYVDSPMAQAATEITLKHIALLDRESTEALQWMNSTGQKPRIHFVQDIEESMQLNHIKHGIVIISASGMCDAGRIQHHLRHHLGRPECAIVIIGFQAEGTLGRRLVDGVKRVRLFGEDVPVRASIHTIGGLSAHADRDALLQWLRGFRHPPAQCFVVHGEAETARGFASTIHEQLGWPAQAPRAGQTVEIG